MADGTLGAIEVMPGLDTRERLTNVPRQALTLRAAFATEESARLALRFIHALADTPIVAAISPATDGVGLSVVEVEIDPAIQDRVLVLIRGAHGVPVSG